MHIHAQAERGVALQKSERGRFPESTCVETPALVEGVLAGGVPAVHAAEVAVGLWEVPVVELVVPHGDATSLLGLGLGLGLGFRLGLGLGLGPRQVVLHPRPRRHGDLLG